MKMFVAGHWTEKPARVEVRNPFDNALVAKVPLAGTGWIPGVSEERTLAKIERMLEKHLEYPVDYLPSHAEVMTGE